MIVSMAIAVLPVWRSPMISSRWPRPIGISASMALMPVWTGVSTDWRTMTPGAMRSTGRVFVVSIGPLSSSGLPSGSTTRPSSAWPTGTSTTRPVVLTVSPSLIAEASPRMTAPTVSSSRLRAMPMTPPGNSSSSEARAPCEPVDLGDAVADLDDRADVARLGIGVERVDRGLDDVDDLVGADGHGFSCRLGGAGAIGARHEALAEPLEAAPDAGVVEGVADPDGEPADQRFVDLDPEVDGSSRSSAATFLLERRGLVLR